MSFHKQSATSVGLRSLLPISPSTLDRHAQADWTGGGEQVFQEIRDTAADNHFTLRNDFLRDPKFRGHDVIVEDSTTGVNFRISSSRTRGWTDYGTAPTRERHIPSLRRPRGLESLGWFFSAIGLVRSREGVGVALALSFGLGRKEADGDEKRQNAKCVRVGRDLEGS